MLTASWELMKDNGSNKLLWLNQSCKFGLQLTAVFVQLSYHEIDNHISPLTSWSDVQRGANSHVSNVSRGAGQDLAWAAEPDRGRKGSVRQCRARQDKIEPGWVDHGRTGSVGRNWACSCKVDHVRAEQCRAGQRQAE